MFLDITRALLTPGTEFPFVISQEIAPQDILGEELHFDNAALTGFFSGIGESVYVRGRFSTVAHARCANCLVSAKAPIEVQFSESFVKGEVPEEQDHFSFEGSKIDFTELAMTLAVLALPMRFLCGEDCTAQCGTCGKNKDHCTCQKELPVKQHPFAALQQLLTKDEEV